MEHILDTFAEGSYTTLIGNTFYVKDCNIKLHCYDRQLVIYDITDALKTGKEVVGYSVDYWEHGNVAAHWILDEYGHDLKKLYNALAALEFPIDGWGYTRSTTIKLNNAEIECTVHKDTNKAVHFWSPFNLDAIKPLKAEPKKWTLRHALRAIINGQFEGLRCTGKYSDDYAYDDAYNYHRGDLTEHAKAFAKRILESPSGWWVGSPDSDGWMSLSCCHFDCNKFKPAI